MLPSAASMAATKYTASIYPILGDFVSLIRRNKSCFDTTDTLQTAAAAVDTKMQKNSTFCTVCDTIYKADILLTLRCVRRRFLTE